MLPQTSLWLYLAGETKTRNSWKLCKNKGLNARNLMPQTGTKKRTNKKNEDSKFYSLTSAFALKYPTTSSKVVYRSGPTSLMKCKMLQRLTFSELLDRFL